VIEGSGSAPQVAEGELLQEQNRPWETPVFDGMKLSVD
jgi:hypothetical protein